MRDSRALHCGLVLMTLLLLATGATAQTYGGTGILKIKPGLQQPGMGQAGVALDHGAQSMWWNPALLASAKGLDGDMTLAQLVPDLADDVYYFNLAGRAPVGSKFGIGVDGAYLTYGQTEAVDEEGQSYGSFHSYEVLVSAGAAGRLVGRRDWEPGADLELLSTVDVGLTLKSVWVDLAPDWAMAIVGESMDGKAQAFALDTGALLQGGTLVPGLGKAVWSIGLNIQNWDFWGSKLVYIDEDQGDPLPRNLKLGIGGCLRSDAQSELLGPAVDLWRVSLAVDMNHSLIEYHENGYEVETDFGWSDMESIWNFGLAITALDFATLQLGYIRDREGEISKVTIGGEGRLPLGALSSGFEGVSLYGSVASIPQALDLDHVLYWTAGVSIE